MSTNTPAHVDSSNISLDILDRLGEHGTSVALRRRQGNEWIDVTLAQFHAHIVETARGLLASGVRPGSGVAILAKTRYEWTVLDYATLWIGAATVPIYQTSSASQIEWILSDSEATHIFYESDLHLSNIESIRAAVPQLTHVASITSVLAELSASGRDIPDAEVEALRADLTSETIASIIYTSGTYGRPKGCILSHGNFRTSLAGAQHMLPELFAAEDASTVLFLPLGHVFARIIQFGTIRFGAVLGHSPDIQNLLEDLGSFKPTYFLAVPRVFEKVFNTASTKAWSDGKGRVFDSAARTAIAWSRAIEQGKSPSLPLRAKHAIFEKSVYSPIREALGGNVQVAISGGAPLGERLGHFYRGLGINVLEGYGMTETTAPVCVNTLEEQRMGTVGKPFPGMEVRLTEFGELEFRGPQLFKGYLKQPDATSDVLSPDGWLSTGDLGEIDDDGFVTITGRKKEVIITAGGKNVSPAQLEDPIRAHKYVSQCVVVGEGRPFVSALITIDTEAWEGSLDDPELFNAIQCAVDEANTQVSQAESIRKFVILPGDWTERNGYLTPSLKVRRQAILRDWHDTVESIYVR